MEEKYKIFIDQNEYQKYLLDYISHGEIDKMLNSTVFADDAKYKSAVIHGVCMASLLTSRCSKYFATIDNEDNNTTEGE